MRLFLAAEIGAPVRAELVRAIERLEAAGADVRWVAAPSIHLTLKFCGELAGPAPLAEQVRLECAGLAQVELEIAGIGQFPASGPPKVIWAGCRGDLAAAAAVAAACERAALRVGVPREERHPFAAHLTIGRPRTPRGWRGLHDAMSAFAGTVFGPLRLDAVTLFGSELTPSGPIYTVVDRFELKPRPSPSV